MKNRETRGGPGRKADPGQSQHARGSSTPSSDMQPEDTGAAASGTPASGSAAESAMKQFAKTGAESGSHRGGRGR